MQVEQIKVERWARLPGFDAYEVSDMGRVRRSKAGKGTRAGRAIKLTVDACGRLVFNANNCGRRVQFKTHRAVMLAFVGPCPAGMEVAHLDGNQQNNALRNLVYATPKENNGHKAMHGTQPRGSKIHCAKLDDEAVAWMRQNATHVRQADMARMFGVSAMTVSQVMANKTWRHVNV